MRVGEDGHVFFEGRRKDVIITQGVKVSPIEVEEALLACLNVVDAGVCGLPDAESGQRIVAALVLEPGSPDPSRGDIIDALASSLADYKLPREIVLCSEIPRIRTTKIDRSALARRVSQILGASQVAALEPDLST